MITVKIAGEQLVVTSYSADNAAHCASPLDVDAAEKLIQKLSEHVAKIRSRSARDATEKLAREAGSTERNRRLAAVWMSYQNDNTSLNAIGVLHGVTGESVRRIAGQYSDVLEDRHRLICATRLANAPLWQQRLRAAGALRDFGCSSGWDTRGKSTVYAEMPPPEMSREEARRAVQDEIYRQRTVHKQRGVDMSARSVCTDTDAAGVVHGFHKEDGEVNHRTHWCAMYCVGDYSETAFADFESDASPLDITCEDCSSLLRDWRGWAAQAAEERT